MPAISFRARAFKKSGFTAEDLPYLLKSAMAGKRVCPKRRRAHTRLGRRVKASKKPRCYTTKTRRTYRRKRTTIGANTRVKKGYQLVCFQRKIRRRRR